jgi:drug/metabolite transporter (DMT)-like permease
VATHRFSLGSLLAFAYLVVPGSIVAYIAFVWLLANAPISTVSTYAYVNPLVAVFLGWALLSEPVTVTIAVGATAVLLAVALIVRRQPGPR